MPVMPTFNSFAATPNAGSAFVGGAGVGQRAVESRLQHEAALAAIAQRASEASMQNQLGMQRLANDQAQAEMANSARQAALQQEMLQKQQQLEVEKAYQQSMIGLKQQEITRQQVESNEKAMLAARQFQAQQKMVQEAQNAFATGQASSPEEAFSQSALNYGLQAGFSGADMAKFSGGAGGQGGMGPARLLPVEGTDKYDYFQTSEGGRVLVPRKPEIPKGVEQIEGTGYERIDGKVVPMREDAGVKQLREDRKRLKDALEGKETIRHRFALANQAEKGKDISAADKYYIDEYKKMQDQLRDIESQLKKSDSGGSGGSTNRVRRYNLQTRKFE